MPEVVIKYKTAKALEALNDLAKYFDFVVEKSESKNKSTALTKTDLPIVFSSNPDVTALSGIWKGRDISLEELRKKAWGNRK